ncbi:MAG: hypothetical protein NTX82_04985 [Candidatus Parcubacteria bacterium]|nr:hypothetical protein [Candidatus Parcubacteria bacterium]
MGEPKTIRRLRTVVPEDDLRGKRMQKILDDHREDPLMPMGELMIASLNRAREADKQKTKK